MITLIKIRDVSDSKRILVASKWDRYGNPQSVQIGPAAALRRHTRAERWEIDDSIFSDLGGPPDDGILKMVDAATPSGTPVVVFGDGLNNKPAWITRTRSEPWALGCGTMVVALEGKTGGYSAARCFLLPRKEE